MSTSLSEQLRRLAVPQTSILVDSRKKASILFDEKEAATKDRRTIYELGCDGLQHLMALNPSFESFQSTLFSESGIQLERSVEHQGINTLLNKNIRKFLYHLSPYFMLRPAHMCLEWLLRRFHINEYNQRDLLALILPYHETAIFAKCLQTVNIKETDDVFNWLIPVAKKAMPLPKTVILNCAASNPAFMTYVCEYMLGAIKQLGSQADMLQAHINFFANVGVGAIEFTKDVKEWHITTLLPCLLKGLSSRVMDFTSATYVIIAQIVCRTQLKAQLLNTIILKVSSVVFVQLHTAAVLLLILIFEKQKDMHPQFDSSTLERLAQESWLGDVLVCLSKEGVPVHYLLLPIIRAMVLAIGEDQPCSAPFKNFMERILLEMNFTSNIAQEIIFCFLDSFVDQPKEVEKKSAQTANVSIIDLDADENMMTPDDFQLWYSRYLQKLEHQYPSAFDVAITAALKSGNTEQNNRHSRAIKTAMSYRMQSIDKSCTDIYESLYHHNVEIRQVAVKTLIANLNAYRSDPHNYGLLKKTLVDHISDESEKVVIEVLKLRTEDFIELLGFSKFVEELQKILYTAQTNDQWFNMLTVVIKHLTCSYIVENFDPLIILFTLMPILLPISTSTKYYKYIHKVIESPLADKITFLKELTNTDIRGSQFTAEKFQQNFLEVITYSTKTPSTMELLRSFEKQIDVNYFKRASHFTHFLLLVTGFMKQQLSGEEGMQLFSVVSKCCNKFNLRYLETKEWDLIKDQNVVPMQMFFDFIQRLVSRIEFVDLHSWMRPSSELKCLLNIFNLLARNAFMPKYYNEQIPWAKTLRKVLQTVFPNVAAKVTFISQFYRYESLPIVECYEELRLRAFKIMNSIINNKTNDCPLASDSIIRILVALSSNSETVRIQALETLTCLQSSVYVGGVLKQFVQHLLEHKQEIGMDPEQFPLVLFTILKAMQKGRRRNVGETVLGVLLDVLMLPNNVENLTMKYEVLKMIKHINDQHIMMKLVALACDILDKYSTTQRIKMLDEPCGSILRIICERFDSSTMEMLSLENHDAWTLFERAFKEYDVFVVDRGVLKPVPCILLQALDEDSYEKMPTKWRFELIKLILKTAACSESDAILLTANKLLKKCLIDCQPLKEILQENLSALSSANEENIKQKIMLKTLQWKEIVVMLEFLEQKKNVANAEKMIGLLFTLLEHCLVDDEEQSSTEYIKQLTLSALLHCSQRAHSRGVNLQSALPNSRLRIDQIVQCMRTTQNPQTHNNALILLSYCASLLPHQVLLNIVDIFTFMGSSVLHQDDSFNFHIINNVIQSIVPILISGDNGNVTKSVMSVLRVFSDIMIDVPQHRRLPIYTTLLTTLDTKQYLWIFQCVVFQTHIADIKKDTQWAGNKVTKVPKDNSPNGFSNQLKVLLELTISFPPGVILQTCINQLKYIQLLPFSTSDDDHEAQLDDLLGDDSCEEYLFDLRMCTAKQFRHYKYTIMTFLLTLTNNDDFLSRISSATDDEVTIFKGLYKKLIVKIVACISRVSEMLNSKEISPLYAKFYKVMLHHLHDVLDNIISLCSADMFLVVTHDLLQHELLSVQKKVLEMFIAKIQQKDTFFSACSDDSIKNILNRLTAIIGYILEEDASVVLLSNEATIIHQTALIAVKLLVKRYGHSFIEEFKLLLVTLTRIAKKRKKISRVLFASVVLALIEISSNLKAHSLEQLPQFMTKIVAAVEYQQKYLQENAADDVSIAIISGIQKIFESLPLFLSPYAVDVISCLSSISTILSRRIANKAKDQHSTQILHRIANIWTKMSTAMPPRVLVPICEEVYERLNTGEHCPDIAVLMDLLLECVNNAKAPDLVAIKSDLSSFFMVALDFRSQHIDAADKTEVSTTEASIIKAFVAWVLKLSEGSFRPIYCRLYDWAFCGNFCRERLLTFFLLAHSISESLKSLFALFAGKFIEDTAELLNQHNTSKTAIGSEEKYTSTELLKAILHTLCSIFRHDNKQFITGRRFELLSQPIVDQLENDLVLQDADLQQALTQSIAQLVSNVSTDIMWKQLNQQILLKTRVNVPAVRILSFNCCVALAHKLGGDFSALLPDSVPFIAELFEDENPRVEKNTRNGVQELESILGESLQKYF